MLSSSLPPHHVFDNWSTLWYPWPYLATREPTPSFESCSTTLNRLHRGQKKVVLSYSHLKWPTIWALVLAHKASYKLQDSQKSKSSKESQHRSIILVQHWKHILVGSEPCLRENCSLDEEECFLAKPRELERGWRTFKARFSAFRWHPSTGGLMNTWTIAAKTKWMYWAHCPD